MKKIKNRNSKNLHYEYLELFQEEKKGLENFYTLLTTNRETRKS